MVLVRPRDSAFIARVVSKSMSNLRNNEPPQRCAQFGTHGKSCLSLCVA